MRIVVALAVLTVACSSAPGAGDGTPAPVAPPGQGEETPAPAAASIDDGLPPVDMTGPVGGARPFPVHMPDGYDASKKYPLLVLLHGYGATGELQDRYLGLSAAATKRGYLVAIPDGTLDARQRRYWNATDACCDLYSKNVDDVAYVRDSVRQLVARYAVDPSRVYLFGHSNGGFLALRLACEESRRFAAVVSLAGAGWADAEQCKPQAPIGVLQIHGTKDATIAYEGGVLPRIEPAGSRAYPGAKATVATFADRNGCAKELVTAEPFDLVDTLPGPDTTPSRHEGCKPNGAAELWTIENGTHIPAFNAELLPRLFTFLGQHARKSL